MEISQSFPQAKEKMLNRFTTHSVGYIILFALYGGGALDVLCWITYNAKRRTHRPPLHYLSASTRKLVIPSQCAHRLGNPQDLLANRKKNFRLRSLCWHYLSSRVGQVLRPERSEGSAFGACRNDSPVDCHRQNYLKIRKESSLSLTLLCVGVTYLSG